MGVYLIIIAALGMVLSLAYILISLFFDGRWQRFKKGSAALALCFLGTLLSAMLMTYEQTTADAEAAGFKNMTDHSEAQRLNMTAEVYYPYIEEQERQRSIKAAIKAEKDKLAAEKIAKEKAHMALCFPGNLSAFQEARKNVKYSLRDPKTAEFPAFEARFVQKLEECGKYRVDAWVRAQNGFGAFGRHAFTIVVTHQGNGDWVSSPAIIE